MLGDEHLYIYKRELLLRIPRKATLLLEISDDEHPIPYGTLKFAINHVFEANDLSTNYISAAEALLGAYTQTRKAELERAA